jgi:hypothetical protein
MAPDDAERRGATGERGPTGATGAPGRLVSTPMLKGRPLELQIVLRFLIVASIIAGTTLLGLQGKIDTAAVTAIYGAALGYATGAIDESLTRTYERLQAKRIEALTPDEIHPTDTRPS